MIKKLLIFSISLVIFSALIFTYYIKEVPFIPLASYSSQESSFDLNSNLVTTPEYYYYLKFKFPNIKKIEFSHLYDTVKDGTVALLPWWQADAKYKILSINGYNYFQDQESAIIIKILSNNVPIFDLNKVTDMAVGGTVVLARGIGSTLDKTNDIYRPWRGAKDFFYNADLAIVNFKSPLVAAWEKPISKWILKGKEKYVGGLLFAGIDLVSLSGNHMGDAGKDGLLETINILKKSGIVSVGAGMNKEQAYNYHIWEVKGVKYAFLAVNSVGGSISKAQDGEASLENVGVSWIDEDALEAVKKAKENADVVVVIANWGKEYKAKPTQTEIYWGRAMVNAGADIILGDQAHWVQNYEFYNNSYIAYGLGNYIFDQYWSEKTKEGILQKLLFYDGRLVNIVTIPVKLVWHGEVKIVKDPVLRQEILNQYYGIAN